MSTLYVESAAAISPLGRKLDDVWDQILLGATRHALVAQPGGRRFMAAESAPGTSMDIHAYAPGFNAAIHELIEGLHLSAPVDAIFFATAVGNLGAVESRIYAGQGVSVADLDFASVEAVFRGTPAAGPHTRFICVPTGCCAGLQAIGLAKSVMPRLGLRTAVIMSLDFGLTPLAFEAFAKINATASAAEGINGSPSRPLCRSRTGFLFADGGGAILVTTEAPDEPVPAITGYGCVSSAYHMTDIETDGRAIRRSMDLALSDAGRTSGDIGHVNLHASGTQQNDEAEISALRATFGERIPSVTTFKGNHGHALGGANLIEVALAWRMLRDGVVPPSPADLSVDAFEDAPARRLPEPLAVKSILKTASGFSGIHASIVMETSHV